MRGETVQQEEKKYKHELGHIKGNSSNERESPQILVARVEPAMSKNVLISTMENGTSQFNPAVLRDI